MNSISFQKWKANGVMRGKCTQTIRRTCDAYLVGRRLELLCEPGTPKAYKLGEGVCTATVRVAMGDSFAWAYPSSAKRRDLKPIIDSLSASGGLEEFAKADGFKNYKKMWEFFCDRYWLAIEQDGGVFHGYLIRWRLDKNAQANCIKNYQRLKRQGSL